MPRILITLVLVAIVGACNRSPDESAEPQPSSPPTTTTAPRIPSTPANHPPTLARHVDDEPYDSKVHADVDGCAPCHAEIVKEWRESTHALASLNNPFYRVIFDEFFETSGPERIDFCAGCHDMVPMFAGKTRSILEPDDPTAHVGISCTTCHGAVAATSDGNASYTLSTAAPPIPDIDDLASVEAHRAFMNRGDVDGGNLCASCHRSFLTPETGHGAAIAGINEWTPWHRSAHGGNPVSRIDDDLPTQGCVDCHMPKTAEGHRSHRFAGGHATLAAAIGSEAQLAAVRAMVEGAATITLGGWGSDPSALTPPSKLHAGERVFFDAVVFNARAGHRFPGGAMDLRDTWTEIVLRDGEGNVLASSGADYADADVDEAARPHLLHSLLASIDGAGVENHRVHEFGTPVYNHTIDARDAAVVRYGWTVDADRDLEAAPVEVELRILQRRLMPSLAKSACENLQTERGARFRRHTELYTGLDVDPCVPQPVLEVARARAVLGSGSDVKDWRHFLHYGMGLRHGVQEDLDPAARVLDHGLAIATEAGDDAAIAQLAFMAGVVAARQNRTDVAMEHFQSAEARVGPHPAIDHARGQALARVFRHIEAAAAFETSAATHPDDRTYARWAISAASVFDDLPAYLAAHAGLAIEPRDPGLLRSQALTLRRLQAPLGWKDQAHRAFLDFKVDEAGAQIRGRCSDQSPDCLLERNPIHVHELK